MKGVREAMIRYFVAGLAVAITVLGLACGGVTATVEPTPLAGVSLTEDMLQAAVLSQEDIRDEFPRLDQITEGSGPNDNANAAGVTLNPEDTSSDLASQGRLEGYSLGLSGDDLVLTVVSSVDLFDSPEAAKTFILRQMSDYNYFQGNQVQEGLILREFKEYLPPNVGNDARRARFVEDALGMEARSEFIIWRRGPAVAMIRVLSFEASEYSEALKRMSLRMDERIDSVLAGEILATDITPVSDPTPVFALPQTPVPSISQIPTLPGRALEVVDDQDYDLASIILTAADLPLEVVVQAEGRIPGIDAVSSYGRDFHAADEVMELGSSKVAKISVTTELHATKLEASGMVMLFQVMDPRAFTRLFGPGLARDLGVSPTSVVMDLLGVPQIGDSAAGFFMIIDHQESRIEGHILLFSLGHVYVQLIVLGPPGKLDLIDTISVAQIIENRVRENPPSPAAAERLKAEGQIGQRVVETPGLHIQEGGTYDGYNSIPPTSGPHWGKNWSACGIYDTEKEVPDSRIVHNLEHGQVVISYNLTDQESIKRLKEIARNLPDRRNWLIMRPYSKIAEGEIAITTWGWLERFKGVDEARIKAFYDAHVDSSPESIPCVVP